MNTDETLGALRQAEREIEQAELRLADCKEAAKVAKEEVTKATLRLRMLLQQSLEPNLFDQPEE